MYGQYFIQKGCADRDGYYPVGADYLCEIKYDIPIEDNFMDVIDGSPVIKAGLMMVSSFLIIVLGFILKCVREINDKYLIFVCGFALLNMLELGIKNNSELETCSFPRWCHEGVNDTIVPSYYYFQREECPRINAWIQSYYEDNLGIGDIDCDNTDYGCCEIREINCESCVREGNSYSFYKYIEERNVGHWTLNIEKNDPVNNCPTIEEMILEISDENEIIKTTLVVTIRNCVSLLIIYIVFLNCIDDKYEKAVGNIDEENPVIFKKSSVISIGSA